ncbi:MAG: PhnD/SsuA/transferrin family substrate-binding protein [Planctomycetes bacterium]|nr:PhnD/SsuA/transferrin family substrate-binding protein [Planctomycetota bacterium]
MSHLGRVAAVLLSALAAHAQAPTPKTPTRITLGVYSFKKPTEVWNQFQPVTVELSRLVTKELGSPAVVELQVTKTYEECLDQFVSGKVDIVRFGPASYVLAKNLEPKVQLLASEKEDSREVGLIVVRDDSPIRSLRDLAGKKFAFGDSQSTIGRYLSQAELVSAGVLAKDLASFTYLERHDSVFKSVEVGDHDAGALHLDTWKELNAKAARKLRVVHKFDNLSKPWLARAGLPPEVVTALTQSLLQLSDPAALKALKVPGFVVSTDAEFDMVRKGMMQSEKFAPPGAVVPAKPASPPAPAKE